MELFMFSERTRNSLNEMSLLLNSKLRSWDLMTTNNKRPNSRLGKQKLFRKAGEMIHVPLFNNRLI